MILKNIKTVCFPKKLFVTMGENDGWRNESFKGQMAKNRGINIMCWFGCGYGYGSEIMLQE